MTKTEEYLQRFTGEFSNDKDRRMLAFRVALDLRSFEIELYWKRATYFWTFLAVTFGGYAAAVTRGRLLAAFVIANAGLVFSTAFLLVHKGSKFWQENWENHVAVLGEETIGSLFSQILVRERKRHWTHKITGPAPISVSRMNEFVSVYLIIIWFCCALYASPLARKHFSWISRHPYAWLSFATLVVLFVCVSLSKTAMCDHHPYVNRLKTDLS